MKSRTVIIENQTINDFFASKLGELEKAPEEPKGLSSHQVSIESGTNIHFFIILLYCTLQGTTTAPKHTVSLFFCWSKPFPEWFASLRELGTTLEGLIAQLLPTASWAVLVEPFPGLTRKILTGTESRELFDRT